MARNGLETSSSDTVSSGAGPNDGPIRWSPDSTTLYYKDGDSIASVDVGPRGPVLASRRVVFSIPRDAPAAMDVMPDGMHAVAIRGGLIYSDIVVLQHALSSAR